MDPLLSPTAVAKRLRIDPSRVIQAIERGELRAIKPPPAKPGRKTQWKVRASDVDLWLGNRAAAAIDAGTFEIGILYRPKGSGEVQLMAIISDPEIVASNMRSFVSLHAADLTQFHPGAALKVALAVDPPGPARAAEPSRTEAPAAAKLAAKERE